jgi:hypothetical protein
MIALILKSAYVKGTAPPGSHIKGFLYACEPANCFAPNPYFLTSLIP